MWKIETGERSEKRSLFREVIPQLSDQLSFGDIHSDPNQNPCAPSIRRQAAFRHLL